MEPTNHNLENSSAIGTSEALKHKRKKKKSRKEAPERIPPQFDDCANDGMKMESKKRKRKREKLNDIQDKMEPKKPKFEYVVTENSLGVSKQNDQHCKQKGKKKKKKKKKKTVYKLEDFTIDSLGASEETEQPTKHKRKKKKKRDQSKGFDFEEIENAQPDTTDERNHKISKKQSNFENPTPDDIQGKDRKRKKKKKKKSKELANNSNNDDNSDRDQTMIIDHVRESHNEKFRDKDNCDSLCEDNVTVGLDSRNDHYDQVSIVRENIAFKDDMIPVIENGKAESRKQKKRKRSKHHEVMNDRDNNEFGIELEDEKSLDLDEQVSKSDRKSKNKLAKYVVDYHGENRKSKDCENNLSNLLCDSHLKTDESECVGITKNRDTFIKNDCDSHGQHCEPEPMVVVPNKIHTSEFMEFENLLKKQNSKSDIDTNTKTMKCDKKYSEGKHKKFSISSELSEVENTLNTKNSNLAISSNTKPTKSDKHKSQSKNSRKYSICAELSEYKNTSMSSKMESDLNTKTTKSDNVTSPKNNHKKSSPSLKFPQNENSSNKNNSIMESDSNTHISKSDKGNTFSQYSSHTKNSNMTCDANVKITNNISQGKHIYFDDDISVNENEPIVKDDVELRDHREGKTNVKKHKKSKTIRVRKISNESDKKHRKDKIHRKKQRREQIAENIRDREHAYFNHMYNDNEKDTGFRNAINWEPKRKNVYSDCDVNVHSRLNHEDTAKKEGCDIVQSDISYGQKAKQRIETLDETFVSVPNSCDELSSLEDLSYNEGSSCASECSKQISDVMKIINEWDIPDEPVIPFYHLNDEMSNNECNFAQDSDSDEVARDFTNGGYENTNGKGTSNIVSTLEPNYAFGDITIENDTNNNDIGLSLGQKGHRNSSSSVLSDDTDVGDTDLESPSESESSEMCLKDIFGTGNKCIGTEPISDSQGQRSRTKPRSVLEDTKSALCNLWTTIVNQDQLIQEQHAQLQTVKRKKKKLGKENKVLVDQVYELEILVTSLNKIIEEKDNDICCLKQNFQYLQGLIEDTHGLSINHESLSEIQARISDSVSMINTLANMIHTGVFSKQ